mgnify:CR=1 FL=1
MVKICFNSLFSFLEQVVSNANGDLCPHYPSKMVVLEYEKTGPGKDRYDHVDENIVIYTETITETTLDQTFRKLIIH